MIMKTALLFVAIGIGLIALTAVPTTADHNMPAALPSGEATAPDRSSVDVDLKLGLNGFRIGARVFGQQGYTGGAWLNGETRPEGFTVDGRVEREGGKSWNFKLNADIDEALRRAALWWGGLPNL
jgi:hypothetical protein